MIDKDNRWTQGLYWFVLAVAIIFVYKTFDNFVGVIHFGQKLLGILSPFLIAFVIAYLLNPAVSKLEKVFGQMTQAKTKKYDRMSSILVVYVILISVIVLGVMYLSPKIGTSIADLIRLLPDYIKEGNAFLRELVIRYPFLRSMINVDEIANNFTAENLLTRYGWANMWQTIQGVWGATTYLLTIFLGIIISIYLLIEKDDLQKQIQSVLKAMFKPFIVCKINLYARRVDKIFMQFFLGKIIVAIIIGILCFIGFMLIQVKYALLLSVIIAVTNLIPYFGAFIGGVPVVLITLFDEPYKALWVAIFITVLQQFDGSVIGPKIIGDSVGLSPFWAVFAILVGGGFFGFMGMLVGVPVVAVVRIILIDLIEMRMEKSQNEGEEACLQSR
ncbi:MAG: AI-2E family transporter [Hyphomonadaceae bacterium]|nr:AI-2E family transporter [Clostridia bacterium]